VRPADAVAHPSTLVRCDEQWLVHRITPASADPSQGFQLDVIGVSPLVRDRSATFFTAIDRVQRFDPADVTLEPDTSSHFSNSRLWLDSVIRRSAVPLSETRIVTGHRALIDRTDYQLRPAEKMLTNLRPRLLIGGAAGLGKTLEIGLPLVRPDSQSVQRELPAGRNPFSSYKRVVVSIDTLKNPHR